MCHFNKIFNINTEKEFVEIALQIFRFQAKYNPVYRQYIDYLNIKSEKITELEKIPFLPIEFFKNKKVTVQINGLPKTKTIIFKSSGTTGSVRSKHFVYDINIYEKSFLSTFTQFFGSLNQYVIIALLPSYIEAGNSSLVYMINKLIQLTTNKDSNFYKIDYQKITSILEKYKKTKQKIILFGVSYALLDLSVEIKSKYKDLIIIETGGMKGRKQEITRKELHNKIYVGFGTKKIYSEYGMTELLSQAYSKENGFFEPAKTMKIFIRDINDPFSYIKDGKTGGINIIDLSNIYSCAFIETKDLGMLKNSKFQVIGRFDNSDIRGCNLLI